MTEPKLPERHAAGTNKSKPTTPTPTAGGEEEGARLELGGETFVLPEPRNTSAQLQPHQKHTLAQAAVQGKPIKEIAYLLRHTPQYIKKMLADPEVEQLITYYQDVVLRATVSFRVQFQELLPKAFEAVNAALHDPDNRVRLQAAKEVFKEAIPTAVEPSVSINLPGSDPEAMKIVSEATDGIKQLLKETQEMVASGVVIPSMHKHLRTTLPGPEDVVGHDSKAQADEADWSTLGEDEAKET